MTKPTLPSLVSDVRLYGKVSEDMLSEFFRQQAEAKPDKPLVLELSTNGGDADVGRRIAQEITLWQAHGNRQLWFFGKSYVYSAGVTIMSAIPPERRFLTRDCELLIHERKMKKQVNLDGALRSCKAAINDILAEIESGQRLERSGFAQLVEGSKISIDTLEERVLKKDWYLTANEAVENGLICGLV
jgi:ATP-dependent protease ClpP protease subunit